jgi:hypothetical protein
MSVAPPLVSLAIADCLISSGCAGITLSKLLHEKFPSARLSEVFLGVAMAITDLHAELLIAQAELLQARAPHDAAR